MRAEVRRQEKQGTSLASVEKACMDFEPYVFIFKLDRKQQEPTTTQIYTA